MEISIIIINYNTKRMLADCLSSVYNYTQGIEFEVLIVDNASTDGSEQYIRSLFPQVKWINSGGNIGFGRANNLGAKYATGKYLLLLNSDTLLLNNALKAFYYYAEFHKDENLGVLGCWLCDNEGKQNNSFGEFPTPNSEIRYLLGKVGIKKLYNIEEGFDVDYIIGADMFIHRNVFEKFSGFDPNFFMYYEETDLQYRMAKAGYIRRIITGPQIIHLEGGSFGSNGLTLNRFMMAQRSYNYYLKKHFRGIKYLYHKGALCMMRLTVFLAKNWSFKDKINAYCEVWK